MPRVSRCDKLQEHDRLRLIGRIGEGVSWRDLAAEFAIPMATIREWSERNGYGRSPVASKRKAVDAMLAKAPSFETAQKDKQEPETARSAETGNPEIDAAAERDAKVARAAAGVCVRIIQRLMQSASEETDPKMLKIIAEANGRAWDTYARINKLDEPPPETANDYAAAAEAVRRKLGL